MIESHAKNSAVAMAAALEKIMGVVSEFCDGISEDSEQWAADWLRQFMLALPNYNTSLPQVLPQLMIFILQDCRPHASQPVQKLLDECIQLQQRDIADEVRDTLKGAQKLVSRKAYAVIELLQQTYTTCAGFPNPTTDAGICRVVEYAALQMYPIAMQEVADSAIGSTDTYKRYADEFLRLLLESTKPQDAEGAATL